MKHNRQLYFVSFCFLVLLLVAGSRSNAQLNTSAAGSTVTNPNGTTKDTTHNKSNTSKWRDEEARITFGHAGSAVQAIPDTSLHTFQRRPFQQPWSRDLGNPGSPLYNLFFTPDYRVGPSLGYHIFDAYRFQLDSLLYYNTNRAYTVFDYQLGSKLEQVAGVLHTQNIRPNWNFMVQYRKVNAPGFYKIQRNNHDNFCFTTSYSSLDKHYTLNAGFVYNKEQHDESGGIVNDSQLNNSNYNDRKTLDATYQNDQYSLTRSSVSNMQRDFGLTLLHSYVFGPSDTTYNTDSTSYTYKIKPRFSISHKLQLSSEKHLFKDLAPDSIRYVTLFNTTFANSGTSYYIPGGDSVTTQQRWFWVDNCILLNGFLGPEGNQLKFSAGAGNRYDEFISDGLASGVPDREQIISNYITGEIKKEAVQPGQWQYGAKGTFYATGDYTGNFDLNAAIGKDFNKGKGGFVVGFRQDLGSAPYSYTNYENAYTKLSFPMNKESVTSLYATLESKALRLSGGVNNTVIENYIYISEAEKPAQYSIPVNITQAWVRKIFKLGSFFLDNELVYQQLPENAPINVPALMGRHQLSYERSMFNRALKIATGVEVRYNTSYYASGYDALLNHFFYQHSTYVSNTPECSLFLNFRIKHFRAFIVGDQLQQLFANNAILFTGTPATNFFGTGVNYTPVYATQNVMLRFGFSWALVD